jgi:hypothetical protein
MVRDSPALDFLNLATVLGKQQHKETDELNGNTTGNKNDTMSKGRGERADSDADADLMGYQRFMVQLAPTDEILQELIGDEDDLLKLSSKDLKAAKAEIEDEKGEKSKSL